MTAAEKWEMQLDDAFQLEFDAFAPDVRDALLAAAKSVEIAGPKTGRPHVDTLQGSKHHNMKELRFAAMNGTQIWRAAFAFDPARTGTILVAADKQGTDEKRFYKKLIKTADQRFDKHLAKLAEVEKERRHSVTPGKTIKTKA